MLVARHPSKEGKRKYGELDVSGGIFVYLKNNELENCDIKKRLSEKFFIDGHLAAN